MPRFLGPAALLLAFSISGHAAASDAPALEPADGMSSQVLPGDREQLELIADLRLQLASLTSESGAYSIQLLESLKALSEALIAIDDGRVALDLLEQQLQIIRVNHGLHHDTQIPIMEMMIDLQASMRGWDEMANLLDRLYAIYNLNEELNTEDSLEGLRRLGQWQRQIIASLPGTVRRDYIWKLIEIEELTLERASEHFPSGDIRLANYHYESALADLFLGLSGLESPEDVRTPSQRFVRMNRGQRHLESIQALFKDKGDKEGEAMALIYMGDAQLIRQQYQPYVREWMITPRRGQSVTGRASRYYREAHDLLTAAGLSEALIEQAFACPVLLPIPTFASTLKQAVEEWLPYRSCASVAEQTPEIFIPHNSINSVKSLITDRAEAYDSRSSRLLGRAQARVKVSIGVNGHPRPYSLQEIAPDTVRNRIDTRNAVEFFQFRPALPDGRPARHRDTEIRLTIDGVRLALNQEASDQGISDQEISE